MKAITVIESDDGSVSIARTGTEEADETIALLHRGIRVTIDMEMRKLAKAVNSE